MPVRDKAVSTLARALNSGMLSYDNLLDEVHLGPEPVVITRDEYYERYETAYVKLIDGIDWNRVLLEASARHMELEHPDEGYDGYVVGIRGVVCAECVNEALLSTKTGGWVDWKTEPKSPRSV